VVEGQALKQAEFRFENRTLNSIPLTEGAGTYPEKVWNGAAMIVVQTTRGNPGWRDIDVDAAMENLWGEKNMPNADGVFYVVVKDGFGRSTRFDIEYQKWQHSVTTSGNTTTTENRWEYCPGGFNYNAIWLCQLTRGWLRE
jgi:hypothetical protein